MESRWISEQSSVILQRGRAADTILPHGLPAAPTTGLSRPWGSLSPLFFQYRYNLILSQLLSEIKLANF